MTGVTYSPFWGTDLNAYTLLDNKMPRLDRIRRVVNRDGFRATRALLTALIGVAPGATAVATHARVSHSGFNAGIDLGRPTILTVTDINRATTSADVTALNEFLTNVTKRPTPYPKDLSGNGGPALS